MDQLAQLFTYENSEVNSLQRFLHGEKIDMEGQCGLIMEGVVAVQPNELIVTDLCGAGKYLGLQTLYGMDVGQFQYVVESKHATITMCKTSELKLEMSLLDTTRKPFVYEAVATAVLESYARVTETLASFSLSTPRERLTWALDRLAKAGEVRRLSRERLSMHTGMSYSSIYREIQQLSPEELSTLAKVASIRLKEEKIK